MSTAARKIVKPAKGVIPAGFANGGKVKPFTGKDTKAEEMAEAKAVRSGKVTPKQYVKREMVEEKKEGEKSNPKKLAATGKALASGKMSAEKYGAMEKKANGGKVSMKKGC
jgi:hypothetical protein